MADANSVYNAAATHFGGLADELERQVNALREKGALNGGDGMTGHFQAQLSRFSSAWLGMMAKFVADERFRDVSPGVCDAVEGYARPVPGIGIA